jgi:hypothetical protein
MTRALFLAIAPLLLLGCGRPFDVKTAPGFVELENQEPEYAYRSVSPEGVVFGVRVIALNEEQEDLSFWTRAVVLHMRQSNGYALLAMNDVQSRDRSMGKELVFGHDENGRPFLYDVRLYVAQDRLFVVETGGAKPEVERYQASTDWMEKSVQVRCKSVVSPVLASRTCNRW